MATKDNIALVRKWFEAVDTGNVAVVDQFIDGKYVDHNPPPFQGSKTGIEGARYSYEYALKAFSDFRHEIEDQFATGDKVVTRVTGYGKHTGEFLGIPATGKDVQMEGIVIHRVKGGKIVEHWAHLDALGLLVQMGVVPPPPA